MQRYAGANLFILALMYFILGWASRGTHRERVFAYSCASLLLALCVATARIAQYWIKDLK
jgi:Ca2+/Na+ antiporter